MSNKSFQRSVLVLALFSILVSLFTGCSAFRSGKVLQPQYLRCEYRVDPKGIDSVQPRLSWIVKTDRRGFRQSAYRILVASDPDKLSCDKGDLWDTGKVNSDKCNQLAYQGQPLQSRQRCYWKVKVWDETGQATAWSNPAYWSMGLLQPSDWKAQWIGWDRKTDSIVKTKPAPLTHARWIWHGPKTNGVNFAPGNCWFRKTLTLPQTNTIKRAVIYCTADNKFQLYINGEEIGEGSNFNVVQNFDITYKLHSGLNIIAIKAENSGENVNPAGLIAELAVELDDGKTIVVRSDQSWKSSLQAAPNWQQVNFDSKSWDKAVLLGNYGMTPWGKLGSMDESRILPARHLRKEFAIEKKLERATVYISGLGYYELYLNGHRIGNHVLDPIYTDYDKRVPYVSYDVTGRLNNGTNAVGVILGNGRFYAPRAKVPTGTRSFGFPKLILIMYLQYQDGSTAIVSTDTSWKLTTRGPIRENNDYDGEVYDARMEMSGWDTPGYDDSTWHSAQLVKAPKGMLSAQMMPPMRVTQTIKPIALTSPKPGVWICDLGQNMVGWCRLLVQAPRGTTIQLRHAETLKKDGTLYTANLRSAMCRDIYICKGSGVEEYEPRFTYHGFRYVELTGLPGKPDLNTIVGRVVHTDMPVVGQFECSNEMLNRIYHNIFWGLQGNYLSIPTDCPQRDERQGWQGDRAAESKGETFFFDNVLLYNKWLVDIQDSQKPNGNLSDVCPAYWPLYNPNVTWPSAFMIIPESMYVQYDDTRNVALHYNSMKKWMNFMGQFLKDGIISKDNYGDWCVPPEDAKLIHSKDPSRRTSGALLATSYYYHNLQLLAEYAKMLDKPSEAQDFKHRAAKIKKAFNRKFFKPDEAIYDNGTQTSCVLPLAFGIVPKEQRQRVFNNLVDNIVHKTDSHIGTGLIGGQWLMRVLTDNGRFDLAYHLATNKDYPSWGYMVEHGATTVWELWNGNTADPAMNSGNHVMLVGDLGIWYYEYLAGIKSDPSRPGFKHIIMRPYFVKDLQFVNAAYRSIYGLISSRWEINNGQFHWRITIPANTTATIYLPTSDVLQIQESARSLQQTIPGVTFMKSQGNRAVINLQSGSYNFTSPL